METTMNDWQLQLNILLLKSQYGRVAILFLFLFWFAFVFVFSPVDFDSSMIRNSSKM